LNAAVAPLADALTQARDARRERLLSSAAENLTARRLGGQKFLVGDRVFDAVSGSAGVVVAKTAAISLDAKAVAVLLDTGATVARQPGDLIWRPTPPEAK
jgi:hypothetical protein